jgi:hypothetical protein
LMPSNLLKADDLEYLNKGSAFLLTLKADKHSFM